MAIRVRRFQAGTTRVCVRVQKLKKRDPLEQHVEVAGETPPPVAEE